MNKAIILMVVLVIGTTAYLAKGTDEPAALHQGLQPDAQINTAKHPPVPEVTTHTPETNGGSEVVLGLQVRSDRNCDVRLDDYNTTDGRVFSAYTCTPRTPRAPHPYAHYDDGSLEVLAYADPEAAALLGRRLAGSNRDKSFEMLLRATALDGDVAHLAWLADQAFSALRVDGALQVENVKRRYELAALATRLGGDPAAARFLRDTLIEAGVNAESIVRLDHRVDALLESVHGIQRTVYGEIRYGGQTDA